jgi:hypothetical protein
MITAVMYAGHGNETMARDSKFAVINLESSPGAH